MIAYFNLNKKELMDLIYSELSSDKPNGMMRQMLSSEGSDREYMRSVSGIEAYRFFTRVVDAAYGVRDEDGVHFRKSPSCSTTSGPACSTRTSSSLSLRTPRRPQRSSTACSPSRLSRSQEGGHSEVTRRQLGA